MKSKKLIKIIEDKILSLEEEYEKVTTPTYCYEETDYEYANELDKAIQFYYQMRNEIKIITGE